jgi:hypothetical protein
LVIVNPAPIIELFVPLFVAPLPDTAAPPAPTVTVYVTPNIKGDVPDNTPPPPPPPLRFPVPPPPETAKYEAV